MLVRFAFTTMLLARTSLTEAQICGDLQGKAGLETRVVRLLAKPDSPVFYFRTEGYVVFVTPKDILESLHSLPPNRIADRLDPLIRARLPLVEDEDLFRFEMLDTLFWAITNAIVIRSIENGRASISNEGSVWSEEVRMVYDRRPLMSTTDVYEGLKGHNRIIGELDCIVG
jgi:hypothetical protein